MLSNARAGRAELGKLPGFLIGSAEAVADEGYTACLRGDVIKVPGVLNLATIVSARATPKWLLRRVSGAIVRRLG